MAKQLNVSMNFTANTSQAKSQIQDLSNMLNKIAYGTDLKVNASGISEASTAAKELSYHLKNAYNVKTGNFDLSALNKSLKGANTDITQLSNKLLTAGKTGQEAFVKLSQTIAQADQPVITMGTHLNNLFNTLKNTLRWQISNSMITGVTGAIQQAFYYAQDLDKSLNNIRIVTSKSSDEMAKFAKEANAAARSLNTTTTKYTDASLIYYQQGLSDEEVKARTDATVKMANVTGDSAEMVSSQMTAIWNNFDDGSKKLEYYADVITALGAATASSSAEIAEGLEKFASVADTVGLSYDYATSALATVVAATRQSADVVGTSFKTLFARIEGLKLNGVDAEDGTTLNKYSQALADVGVNIKDANGQLKDMDDILNELGAKWETLDKNTQVALAQTVGGARQYTQLIALMDNWGEFQKNLGVAQGSEGTLQEQADIYAESWEAAKDRVRASVEGIYDSLINEDFFKDLDNWLAKMLDGIGDFIDGIGGAKGVLLGIGTLAVSLLSKRISPMMDKLKSDISVITGGAQRGYQKMSQDMNSKVEKEIADPSSGIEYTEAQKAQLRGNSQVLQAKAYLSKIENQLTQEERASAEFQIEALQTQQQEVIKLAEQYDEVIEKIKAEKQAVENLKQIYIDEVQEASKDAYGTIATLGDNLETKLRNKIKDTAVLNKSIDINTNFYGGEDDRLIQRAIDAASNGTAKGLNLKSMLFESIGGTDYESLGINKMIAELDENIEGLKISFPGLTNEFDKFKNSVNKITAFDELSKKLSEFSIAGENEVEQLQSLEQILNRITKGTFKSFSEATDEAKESIIRAEQNLDSLNEKEKKLGIESSKAGKQLQDSFKNIDYSHTVTGLQAVTATAAGLGQVAMAITSIKSAWETITNPDTSGWEKAVSLFMGISMVVPSIIGAFGSMVTILQGLTAAHRREIIAEEQEIVAQEREAVVNKITNELKERRQKLGVKQLETLKLEIDALDDDTRALLENAIAQGLDEKTIKSTMKEQLESIGLNLAHEESVKKDTLSIKKRIAAKLEEMGIDAAMLGPLALLMGMLALVAGSIYLTYQRTHKARIEAEKAAEDLKTINEAFEEVNSNIQNTISTLDGLNEKYKSIQDMTYGTTEWGKSVRELNADVQDLIDQYDNLEKGVDYFRDAEGVLQLTQSGQDKIRDQANMRLDKAQQVKSAAELSAKAAQLEADKEPILKNNLGNYYTNSAKEGDPNKDIATENDKFNNSINQLIDELSKASPESTFDEILAKSGIDDNVKDLINKDEELKTSIEDLADATRKLSDDYENNVIDQLLNSNNLESIDEDYRTGVLEQVAEGSKNQVEARMATITPEELADAKKDWAKDAGYAYDGTNMYKTDENGGYTKDDIVTIEDLDERVKRWKAEQEVVESCDKSIQNYNETVEESKKVWEAAGNVKDEWNELAESTGDADSALKQLIKDGNHVDDFAKILGVTKEEFNNISGSTEFLNNNLSLIKDTLNGDAEAAEQLRNEFARIQLQDLVGDGIIELGVDINDEVAVNSLNSLFNWVDQAEVGFEVGADTAGAQAEIFEALANLQIKSEEEAAAIKKVLKDVFHVEFEWEQVSQNATLATKDSRGNPRSINIKENTWVPKYNIGGDGNLTLTKATKLSSADIVRSSSYSNPTTPSAKTPDSGSGSGKGKGSGSGSSKETKDKDESEVERYYVINQVLKELTSQMTKLGKEKDRAFGANKLKAINNEIVLLQQQKKAQQEYLREAKMYRNTDQAGLKNLFGGKFNAQGIFTNYDEIFAKEQKAYNDAVAKYNKSGQSDADKNRLAEAEARWNKFSDLAKQYESDLQDVQKAEEDIQDTINEIADKSLEIIQYTVQLKLDMAEDTKKYLDFLLSGAERKEFNVAEQIAITGKTAQVYSDQRAAASQGLADIFGAHGLTTKQAASLTADQLSAMNFTEDEVDTIREYRDTVIEANEALADLADTINEYVTKALDEWMDKLDKSASNYEHLNKLLNDYKNILGLIDQKATGIDRKLIEDLSQAMLNNARNKYDSSVESYNALKQLEKQYQAELDDAIASGDAQRIAYWTTNMEDLQERIKDANETMLENWQETLEIAQKNFQETVKATLDSMYDSIGGLANFDLLKQQFEYEKDLADDYIDDFNKAYELNKLNRKIQNSLDDTKGIKNKELLRDLQKEINDLQASGAQISKYDLEYLQKKYEMRKAEIALEEAQNAKTTVRMRQDNEGNWGYVYTADQDNIDNAKQTYEDKLADLYNLTKDYNESVQDEYMKILDEYNKAVEDAAARYGNDSEAFAQAMAAINEFYGQKLTYLSGELGKTFANNHDLYVHDTQYYQDMTDTNIFNSEMFAQKFDETVLGTLKGMPDTLEELNTNVESSWDRASETVTAAYNTLYDYLYGEQGIAPSIAAVTQEATKDINDASKATKKTINEDTQAMTDDMQDVIDKVVDWQKKWTTNIAAMNTSDAKLIKELGEILTKLTNIGNSKPTPQVEIKYKGVDQLTTLLNNLEKLKSKTVTITTKYVTSGSPSGNSSGADNSSTPTTPDPSPKASDAYFVQYLGKDGKSKNYNFIGWDYAIKDVRKNAHPNYAITITNNRTGTKKSGSYNVVMGWSAFDTGGYTGEWDSSGKLAVLHQKEIVLNKDDTANFLAGISVLRDIVKQIDLRSLAERDALSNISVSVPRDSQNAMQQNVVINADFPAAQNHSEIEMAFENLLGKATQFANRKK